MLSKPSNLASYFWNTVNSILYTYTTCTYAQLSTAQFRRVGIVPRVLNLALEGG